MLAYFYPALLTACVFFIFWKGRSEERIVLSALLMGSIATAAIHSQRASDWLTPSIGMIVNELLVTTVILMVAFRSKNLWPLPVASFQLLALMAQIVNLFGERLQAYAIGVTQGLWAYLQLIILLYVTVRKLRIGSTPRA
jgi:hypothetical protein